MEKNKTQDNTFKRKKKINKKDRKYLQMLKKI